MNVIKNPAEYKTPIGLFRASLQVIENYSGPRRLGWMLEALQYAEHGMHDTELRDVIATQFRERAGITTH